MASLYRKPIRVTDPRTGEKVRAKSKKWWGRYRDENGDEKRVPLAVDRAAAQTMLAALVKKAERRAAGLEDPFDKHQRRPLKEHLDEFIRYLENKASTDTHVKKTEQRARAIIEGCKFERINQISPSRVQEYLANLRADGRSTGTSNHYLRAIKMFSRWLVRDRRTNEDRLTHMSRLNEDTDRRRVRRPLSVEEFARTGAAPKTAQLLARHSDINLTMNTYTMLGVMDQVAAVEALPAVPESKPRPRLRAVG